MSKKKSLIMGAVIGLLLSSIIVFMMPERRTDISEKKVDVPEKKFDVTGKSGTTPLQESYGP